MDFQYFKITASQYPDGLNETDAKLTNEQKEEINIIEDSETIWDNPRKLDVGMDDVWGTVRFAHMHNFRSGGSYAFSVVSPEFKSIFEQFKLPPHAFYPITLRYKEVSKEYFVFHIFESDYFQYIDYSKSTFYVYHWKNKETIEILKPGEITDITAKKLKSKQLRDIDRKLELKVREITYKEAYDIFPLKGIRVSQRVKDVIEQFELPNIRFWDNMPFKIDMPELPAVDFQLPAGLDMHTGYHEDIVKEVEFSRSSFGREYYGRVSYPAQNIPYQELYEQAAARITTFPEPVKNDLLKYFKPSLKAVVSAEAETLPWGASRVGGVPDSQSVQLQLGKQDMLVAQLNFAELAKFSLQHSFPPEGMLYVTGKEIAGSLEIKLIHEPSPENTGRGQTGYPITWQPAYTFPQGLSSEVYELEKKYPDQEDAFDDAQSYVHNFQNISWMDMLVQAHPNCLQSQPWSASEEVVYLLSFVYLEGQYHIGIKAADWQNQDFSNPVIDVQYS